MKLAIVGSRTWTDGAAILERVRHLQPILIITGGAAGADRLGMAAADRLGIPRREFLPDWAQYGRCAGAVRNRLIVDACDKLIAFWDGTSSGTKISIDMARRAGKLLEVVGVNSGVKK